MKILMVCAAYPPFGKGGGPVSSQLLAQALVQAGAEVRVISVADDAQHFVKDGVDVHFLPNLNIYSNYWVPRPAWKKLVWHVLENFNPRAYFAMGRQMDLFKPDVVLTVSIENTNVATWLAAARRKIPLAHMLYSYFAMCWSGSMYRAAKNCAKPCLDCKVMSAGRKMLSGKVDLLCAEAQSTIDVHLQHGFFDAAQTFALPAAVLRSTPSQPRHGQAGPLRIGYLGVLTSNKGVDVLAAAAARMTQRNVRFAIGGTGDEAYVERLKTAFDGVEADFAGWVKAEEFLSDIDVLVVPSLWREPFGRVCVEAYLAGIPVVASRIGGLAEIVKDGVSGFRFEPGNAVELAGILDKIAGDPELRERLSQGVREQVPLYEMGSVGRRMFNRLKILAAIGKG